MLATPIILSVFSSMVMFNDCNGNGIDDATEIAKGTLTDCQPNGIPDECERGGVEPVAYWRFETDFGTEVIDSGPLGLNGQNDNAAPTTQVGPMEIPQTNESNAGACDLTGQVHVTVDDSEQYLSMGGESFTVEAWVKLNQLSDASGPNQRQTLVQKKPLNAGGATLDYLFLVQGGNTAITFDDNYGKPGTEVGGRELVAIFGNGSRSWSVTSYLKIIDLEWHHVAFCVNMEENQVEFVVDGVREIIAFDGNPDINDGPLLIGAHTNASGTYNHFLRGQIDELRVVYGVVPDELLLNGFEGGDCDGDLVPDGCEIASGDELDCDGNGQPDVCQLVGNDCDGNGVPDQCDPDCNENGIPDACDIAGGSSEDCQLDGVPDECQIINEDILRYDLYGWGYVAFRSDVPHMVWLQRFNADSNDSVISAIEADLGIAPAGQPMTIGIWSDPDGDGDPEDAQLIWSNLISFPSNEGLIRYEIPSVMVGDRGASFFVGFAMEVSIDPVSGDFPAVMDVFGFPETGRAWLIGGEEPLDLNDLRNGAAEYALVEEAYMLGNWVIRVEMDGPGIDCNGNGNPDECDIAEGISSDLDGDQRPDECGDCNGNGILDGFEIADGTSQDCDGDSIPDECVILFGDCNEDGVPDICTLEAGAGDCNENGILDQCDIASGMAQDIDGSGIPDDCEDCNGNGVLDSGDIIFGTSDDCDGNGVPDECGFGEARDPMLYGTANSVIDSNLNVIGAVELVWMKSFVAEEGGEWISAIEVVWGSTYPGQFAKVVVWTDPDGDGAPLDARVKTEVITESINVLAGQYTTVQIPPTYVGPAGTSFLVGVYYDNGLGGAPIALDYDDLSGNCWWAATVEYGMDIDDLNGTAYVAQAGSFEFMIRAIGSDGRYTGDCDDDGFIDGCDIATGDSDDVNGNGVPDECEDFCQGDLDGNGRVDGADLGLFFAQWKSCLDEPCSADLNGDGEVNGIDLGIILSAWGICSG